MHQQLKSPPWEGFGLLLMWVTAANSAPYRGWANTSQRGVLFSGAQKHLNRYDTDIANPDTELMEVGQDKVIRNLFSDKVYIDSHFDGFSPGRKGQVASYTPPTAIGTSYSMRSPPLTINPPGIGIFFLLQ